MRRLLLALAFVIGLVHVGGVSAFPSRPITIIVPYGAGGATDMFARTLAAALGVRMGTSVVVENVPGAGGTIGIQRMNNAPADGHTLIVASGMEYEMQNLVNPGTTPRATEMVPIGNFGSQPMVLVVRPALGVRSLDAFIALAQAKPGVVSLASVGPGTALQLTGLVLQQAAGIQLNDVSYKGAGQIVTDLLAGHVDAAIMTVPVVEPHLGSGKLLALGVSQATRSSVLPQVPSFSETPALKGSVDATLTYPLYARKGTPGPVIDQLRQHAAAVLADPLFQSALLKLMIAPAARISGEDVQTVNRTQLAAFTKALAAKGRP